MNNQQLYLAMAVGPIMSLVIVIAGYIVQNANLNAEPFLRGCDSLPPIR